MSKWPRTEWPVLLHLCGGRCTKEQRAGQSRMEDFILTQSLKSLSKVNTWCSFWDGMVQETPVTFLRIWGKGALVQHLLVVHGHVLWTLEPLSLPLLIYPILFSTHPQLSVFTFLSTLLLALYFSWVMSVGGGSRGTKEHRESFVTGSQTAFKPELVFTTSLWGQEALTALTSWGMQRLSSLCLELGQGREWGFLTFLIIRGFSPVFSFLLFSPTKLLWGGKLNPCLQGLASDRITLENKPIPSVLFVPPTKALTCNQRSCHCHLVLLISEPYFPHLYNGNNRLSRHIRNMKNFQKI